MMRPPLPISGSTARVTRYVPVTFVSTVRRQRSMSEPATGSPPPTPALFTSTSTRGAAARSASPARSTEASLVRSTSIGSARPPFASSSWATASSCDRVRPATATNVSGPPSASAMARPIPRPPPVTTETVTLRTYFSTLPLFHFSTCAQRLVFIFGVEPRVFLEERQRIHRLHPIEEQHAVEVIRLVLRDARGESLERQLDGAAVAIERADHDLRVAGNHPADIRDAQAAFPSLFNRRAVGKDLGVDDDGRLALRVGVLVQQCDEQAQPFVHLRRGEADAVLLVHRVDHVVDQFLERCALDVGFVERPRAFTEDRMAHARDFEDRHEARLYGVQRRHPVLRAMRRPARSAAAEGARARASRPRPLDRHPYR